MPTQLIAGDNQNEASFAGGNDGALEVRIGPAGSKATGLSVSSVGDVAALGKLTQKGGAPVPRMLLLPVKATTSGTSIDFSSTDGTAIPSWAKKLTVMLSKVSTNGVSPLILQFNSETTGYEGSCTSGAAAVATITASNGVPLTYASIAAQAVSGNVIVGLLSANTMTASVALGQFPSGTMHAGGASKITSAALDRVRLTTVNGTDVFDAGSISILVEGYE